MSSKNASPERGEVLIIHPKDDFPGPQRTDGTSQPS